MSHAKILSSSCCTEGSLVMVDEGGDLHGSIYVRRVVIHYIYSETTHI